MNKHPWNILSTLILGQIDNTQVRAALRNDHKFGTDKVRETMIILAELEFDFHRKVPTTSKYLLYFYLVLAFVMIIVGVVLTFVFWKMGFLVLATLFVVVSGFGLLVRTNKLGYWRRYNSSINERSFESRGTLC